MKRKRPWLAGTLIAAAALAALWPGPVTRTYTIRTPKLRADQSFRAALVTDLHSRIYGRDQQPLIDCILSGAPDAVLLAGDIYDDKTDPTGVRLLLAGLEGRVPLYYVTGNHEHRVADLSAVTALFDEFDVVQLSDAAVEAEWNGVPVTVAGIDDPAAHGGSLDAVAAALDGLRAGLADDRLSVLLAHRPAYWPLYHGFDLVVSGHAHGGQVRVPGLLNGLLAPDEGLFPQYAGGLYWHGGQAHIVSRGLAQDWKPRVFNPTEVVWIDVTSTEAAQNHV